MRARELTRRGQSRARRLIGRAGASAARSVCWMAQVFGATSATTKNRVTLAIVAANTPQAPKSEEASTPRRVDWISWLESTTSSVGLSHSWCSTSERRTSPRLPCVSASAIALAFETRVRAVSATARRIEKRNSSATAAAMSQSVPVIGHPGDGGACTPVRSDLAVGRWSPAVMVAVEQLALARLHDGRLLGLGVVHAEDVEDAVDDEERDLVLVAAGVLRGLAGGHGRADHDVAEEH